MNDHDKEENDQYLYTIVSFPTEKKVDLVPSTWVYEKEGQTFCWYPPSKNYSKIERWLVECAEPQEEWESYGAKIVSRSKTLAKGKKRLRRSYTTMEVDSTDRENQAQPTQPLVLPSSSLKKMLQEVPSIPARSRGFSVLRKEAANSSKTEPKKHLENILSDVDEDDVAEKNSSDIVIANIPINTEYMDCKFKELTMLIHSEINSAKRSILYDLERKISEVKHTIISNGNNGEAQKMNLTEAKNQLGIALPIGNLAEFTAFDESFQEQEKKSTLMILYRILVAGEQTSKTCISKIMSATMTKTVEMEFFGTGRKVHGKGKLDFSRTQVFHCLQDAILEKFDDNTECENLAAKVGRWLSGACDREGGRKTRAQEPNADNRN